MSAARQAAWPTPWASASAPSRTQVSALRRWADALLQQCATWMPLHAAAFYLVYRGDGTPTYLRVSHCGQPGHLPLALAPSALHPAMPLVAVLADGPRFRLRLGPPDGVCGVIDLCIQGPALLGGQVQQRLERLALQAGARLTRVLHRPTARFASSPGTPLARATAPVHGLRPLYQRFDEEVARAERHRRAVTVLWADTSAVPGTARHDGAAWPQVGLHALRHYDALAVTQEGRLWLLLPECDFEGGMANRRRVQAHLQSQAPAAQVPVGVATWPDDGHDLDALIECARLRAQRWHASGQARGVPLGADAAALLGALLACGRRRTSGPDLRAGHDAHGGWTLALWRQVALQLWQQSRLQQDAVCWVVGDASVAFAIEREAGGVVDDDLRTWVSGQWPTALRPPSSASMATSQGDASRVARLPTLAAAVPAAPLLLLYRHQQRGFLFVGTASATETLCSLQSNDRSLIDTLYVRLLPHWRRFRARSVAVMEPGS
ncbi:MAG: hypothetical protein ACPGUV_00190 [Polyangiales bacterium]